MPQHALERAAAAESAAARARVRLEAAAALEGDLSRSLNGRGEARRCHKFSGMRFAFKTAPQHTTWQDMLAVWRAADDIELFESGWVFDHFYPIYSDSTGPCLEGWMSLAALAQATRRLRLGALVTGIHYRHPAVLANMAATLDIVSGGQARDRARRGLERGGVGRLRHRPRLARKSAVTASRRPARSSSACSRTRRLRSRAPTTS